MDSTFALTMEPQTEAETQTTIAQLFAEMHRMNETMQRDQIEIDRNKLETQRLKAETRATLDRLGALL